jgi:hypothetical protein
LASRHVKEILDHPRKYKLFIEDPEPSVVVVIITIMENVGLRVGDGNLTDFTLFNVDLNHRMCASL